MSASTGCGSETTTYLDPQYDFSFTYDTSWDLIETPDGELPAGASRSVGAFDPRGSDAGNDLTFDYVAVDVYVLDPSQTPTFQELTDGFDFYLKQLETSDDSLVVIDQPTVTVVNGRPALLVTYMYTANDTEVRCSEYRIIQPGGAMLFGLYTQSSTANWERNTPDFDIFLNSFTVDASQ